MQILSRGARALRRIPVAARVCAVVAILNAACWSVLTPPFEAVDEPDHFAYVQELAENGRLPSTSNQAYAPAERIALRDLHFSLVHRRPESLPIASRAQAQRLARDLARDPSRQGHGGAGVAASQPPLYYALETIPYALGASGTILDQLALMRLLSALMAGVTALFVFLFLREALRAAPWVWVVGGLAAALSPLLASASSGVNPDALLFAVAAATFYCLARAYRRGLSAPLAVATGATIAAGFATKYTYIGIVPGALLGLVLIALRDARRARRTRHLAAYRPLALAGAVAASPVLLFAVINLASGHEAFSSVSGAIALTGQHAGTLPAELSYIWQLYLPRLPAMHNYFPGVFMARDVWFDGLVGAYGWLDTLFSDRVYDLALIPAGVLLALCVRALIAERRALRARASELSTYTAMCVGMLALIGASSYLSYPEYVSNYRHPRYLLPLLAIYAGAIALAARGAGRRLGPAVGALIVVLLLGHDILSQLLVISRYYS